MPRPRKNPTAEAAASGTPPSDAKPPARAKKGDRQALGTLAGPQALNQAVWAICDVLRRAGVGSALRYVPELTWILFLRVLDEQEAQEREEAEALGLPYTPTLEAPWRWQDWAAPPADEPHAAKAPTTSDGRPQGWKRRELMEGRRGDFFAFVNAQLLPQLRRLRDAPGASAKQKVLSEILSPVERVRIDTEANFCDVLDRVHALRLAGTDTQHQFLLSQVYEGLLLKMGEKNSDGGQFYTPRELIRAMVRAVDPKIGDTVCDPCCGTGGFLAEAAEHMRRQAGDLDTGQLETLKHRSFYGREKDDLAYPIALANLMLHGVDEPHIWHGNTLSRQAVYGGLYEGAPDRFHVVLTNPPFGGKEGVEAQAQFPFKTRATQVLFVQHLTQILEPGGRCGVVLDEGFLYRTNEDAFVRTKRKLLDENDVWCIVSLPGGAFTGAGAGVKTNLVFFTRGRRTERIWYYDLSHVKVGKKTPLTLLHFDHFFRLLPQRGGDGAETEHSWTLDFSARLARAREEAAPLRREAETRREAASAQRERMRAARRSGDDAEADRCAAAVATAEKAAREAAAKAEAIEDAAYDLKAVNPREVKTVDRRTPAELLAAIEAKGRDVDEALARLKRLIDAAHDDGLAFDAHAAAPAEAPLG
jgi:type I restriction enzyme M protein